VQTTVLGGSASQAEKVNPKIQYKTESRHKAGKVYKVTIKFNTQITIE